MRIGSRQLHLAPTLYCKPMTTMYHLPPEEDKAFPKVCFALDQALEELDKDREFLTAGGVFTNDTIDAYIALKHEESQRARLCVHPIEFEMYYSC